MTPGGRDTSDLEQHGYLHNAGTGVDVIFVLHRSSQALNLPTFFGADSLPEVVTLSSYVVITIPVLFTLGGSSFAGSCQSTRFHEAPPSIISVVNGPLCSTDIAGLQIEPRVGRNVCSQLSKSSIELGTRR